MLFVEWREAQSVAHELGAELFPNWNLDSLPVLFYRPNVQELLINFPHKPEGFTAYNGFDPVGSGTTYVRTGKTFFDIDDQNTTLEVEGVTVLVVADPYSRMRNQLRDILSRPQDVATTWLDHWNFIPSPYDELRMMLHEGFHVYQHHRAPDKSANEMLVAKYPLLDPVNNALYVLEGQILRDALILHGQDRAAFLENARMFCAVRAFRHSRLDSSLVEYEQLNEYAEGLAKYVEYRFLLVGERLEPGKEMHYHQGFSGYRGVLPALFADAIENMVDVVAVNDDRFGNKFGSGPLRFKLYELGACQALLLDELMPDWKSRIFGEGVFLTDLVNEAVGLSTAQRPNYLEGAMKVYGYEAAYEEKWRFKTAGEAFVQAKLKGILESPDTLVRIHYDPAIDRMGVSVFTPFGVTQVDATSSIYDLVPVEVMFKQGGILTMKQAVPVLVDKEHHLVAFSLDHPSSGWVTKDGQTLETNGFVLSGTACEIVRTGRTIDIELR